MFNDILSEVLGTILNRQAVELERSRAIHAA
jgi:purine catabolism regulator